MNISELETLASQVYEDAKGYVEGRGFDVLPIRICKLPEDKAGLTFVIHSDGNQTLLNENLQKSERPDCLTTYATVHSALMVYAMQHLKNGNSVYNRPSFVGFASGIENWIYEMMDKEHGSRYDFSGFDKEAIGKFSSLGSSEFSIGRDAYDNVRTAFDENDWQGNFERPILDYVYNKTNEIAFKQIAFAKPVEMLEGYLTSTGIARMEAEQINIRPILKNFVLICETGFLSLQWRDVRKMMQEMGEYLDKVDQELSEGWKLIVANLNNIFEHIDDPYHKIFEKIYRDKEHESLRDQILELMYKTGEFVDKHMDEKRRLFFSI